MLDFDRAMYKLVDALEKSGKTFRLLLVGDHGHGLLSDSGDAAAILFANRDADSLPIFDEISRSPVLTHFTMNALLLRMLGSYCASHGIPIELCGKCSYGTTPLSDWTVSFEFNHLHGQLTADLGAQSTLNFNSTTVVVKLVRPITCRIGHDGETTHGIQISINVERAVSAKKRCSAQFDYDYGGDMLISAPSTAYLPFYKCACLKADDIYISLKELRGKKACISLKERIAYTGKTQALCKDHHD